MGNNMTLCCTDDASSSSSSSGATSITTRFVPSHEGLLSKAPRPAAGTQLPSGGGDFPVFTAASLTLPETAAALARRYRDEGYVIVEGVYSAEEMAAWKRGINENLAKVCLSAGTRIAQCVCSRVLLAQAH